MHDLQDRVAAFFLGDLPWRRYNQFERRELRAPRNHTPASGAKAHMEDRLHSVLHSAQHGRLLRLTLNRPDKRNALDRELCRALIQALEQAEADPSIGAILLDANGKSFCAGMDLDQAASDNLTEIHALHERLFTIGARLRKPLVAAVQGAALGGGTGVV